MLFQICDRGVRKRNEEASAEDIETSKVSFSRKGTETEIPPNWKNYSFYSFQIDATKDMTAKHNNKRKAV